MNQKILITGGAGFIGSAIVQDLQRTDSEVHIIDDLSFGNRSFVRIPDSHFHQIDICDKQKVKKVLEAVAPEIVIHLAAVHFIPYCNAHPFESARINILGTANLLDAIKELGLKPDRLFFASTAAVYPISDMALTEEHPVEPLDIYGLSKLAGERLCHEFFLETGTPTVVCRFFNAFGPNETNPHLIPEIQQQLRQGHRTIKLGNLTPRRDFIHTADMAAAVRLLLETKLSGFEIFNLGRGIEYSVREIVAAFERQLGEKIQIETDPARVRKVERQHLLADISKLQSLGWQPQWSIDEGIKTLLDTED